MLVVNVDVLQIWERGLRNECITVKSRSHPNKGGGHWDNLVRHFGLVFISQ